MAAGRGWQREFDDPIDAPDGTRLNTLREAIAYLAKIVPKAEREMPAVTTAAEMLTYAAERGIAWMFMARIGVMQALHRHEVRQFNPDRKDTSRLQPGAQFCAAGAVGPCSPRRRPHSCGAVCALKEGGQFMETVLSLLISAEIIAFS